MKRVEDDRMPGGSELRIAVTAAHHSHRLILLHLQSLKILAELLILLCHLQLRSDKPEIVLSRASTVTQHIDVGAECRCIQRPVDSSSTQLRGGLSGNAQRDHKCNCS